MTAGFQGAIPPQQVVMHLCGLSPYYISHHPVEFFVKEAGRWGIPRGAVSNLDFVVVCLQPPDSFSVLFCCPVDTQLCQPLRDSFVDVSCALAEVKSLACLASEVNQNPAVFVWPASSSLNARRLLSADQANTLAG